MIGSSFCRRVSSSDPLDDRVGRWSLRGHPERQQAGGGERARIEHAKLLST